MSSRFGFSTEPSSGGEYTPIVKFDARAGRMFRIDRVQGGDGNYTNDPVDITDSFKAIFDFENVETGWINFSSGGAPDFRLVRLGGALPARPSDLHKNGIRFMLKLAKDCAGEKPIREIAGTAKVFLNAVEKVFDDYDAGKGDNPGMLPVVAMRGSTPIKSGQGQKQSTNYMPRFELVGWAPRGDLVFVPKGGAAPQQQAAPQPTTPPSTGATRAEPPQPAPQRAPEPAMADDDFG